MDKEPTEFVVTQQVWVQVSSDYMAAASMRTLVVKPETTVADIMRWAMNCNVLGRGDVTITAPDVNAYNARVKARGEAASP